jgi:hypothetical protein
MATFFSYCGHVWIANQDGEAQLVPREGSTELLEPVCAKLDIAPLNSVTFARDLSVENLHPPRLSALKKFPRRGDPKLLARCPADATLQSLVNRLWYRKRALVQHRAEHSNVGCTQVLHYR